MTRRSTILGVAGLGLALELVALVHQVLTPAEVDFGWSFRGFMVVPALTYIGVGTAICLRDGRNRIGWLLLLDGVLFAFSGVASEYAIRGLIVGSAPGAIVAAWFLQWAWTVMFGVLQFVFLLFPDGELTRKGRFFARFGIAVIAMAAVFEAFYPRPLDSFATSPSFKNPYEWSGVALGGGSVEGIVQLLWAGCLVGSAISVFARFRGATGIRRLQLKWFAVGAVFTALTFFSIPLLREANGLQETLTVIGVSFLPITIGIAILRYRLYEIDVIINRTLVYGSLTAILAISYLTIVFLLQALLAPLTSESDLAIAASTLVVAGLFRPLRTRVQSFIDRRFYRRRYDAAKTVQAFSSHLRDEIDLHELSSDLVAVVQDTMQPAYVSLWLRDPAGVTK